jgi:hypothetical protein
MKNKKTDFIDDEIWVLTFGGAFQRANVYAKRVSDVEKKKFRQDIKNYIKELDQLQYKTLPPSSEKHIENITVFCGWAVENYYTF